MVGHIQELRVAEREAAAAAGVDWRRYTWARERVDQLLTLQRQREDRQLLQVELTRTRTELETQLAKAPDAASRKAIEARLATLRKELDALKGEQKVGAEEKREQELIAAVRAELAALDSHQEKVQKQVKAAVGSYQLPSSKAKLPKLAETPTKAPVRTGK